MSELFDIRDLVVDVGARASRRRILDGVNLMIERGCVTALLGHNGSGKSTLLKVLARQLSPSAGEVVTLGRPQSDWSRRDHARCLAYLPQYTPGAEGTTVRQLVALGRYPWHGALGRPGDEDKRAVDNAICECGLIAHQDRLVDTLSGGERQRAWLAMMLAQGAEALLLDEPISALDVAHQLEVMNLVQALSQRGKSVVIVLHDVNLAARFADRIVAMKQGGVVMEGIAADLMTPEALSRIYGLPMDVVERPGHAPIAVAK